jgi:hypothetical protein
MVSNNNTLSHLRFLKVTVTILDGVWTYWIQFRMEDLPMTVNVKFDFRED